MRKEHLGWLIAWVSLLAAGCSSQDADQLGRVARLVGAKFDNLTGAAQERLANGLQAARASWTETTPEVRVAERLRWDKQLANTDIQIDSPSPGAVRLHGAIAELALRRRAVEIAETTLGVEKVIDELGPSE